MKQTDDEMLLVCDEQGNPCYPLPRRMIHAQGLWHRVVHLWFTDQENLYFQQRSADKKAFPLGYDITCAGHIAPEEEPISACIRECEEELGIILPETALAYIGRYRETMLLTCGLDKEIADVFITHQIPSQWHLNDEVLTVGSISRTEFYALITKQSSFCRFYDLLDRQMKVLSREQLMIHEPAYYEWLFQAIDR